MGSGSTLLMSDDVEEAVLETEDNDEESSSPNWLLIIGLGLVAMGFIWRWWRRG